MRMSIHYDTFKDNDVHYEEAPATNPPNVPWNRIISAQCSVSSHVRPTVLTRSASVICLPLVKYPAAILASISTRESGGRRCSAKHRNQYHAARSPRKLPRTWNVVPLQDGDTRLNYGVVFPEIQESDQLYAERWKRQSVVHVTHGHHVINLLDAEPVEYVGHERLEAHVLNTRDEFRRLEVLVRGIAAAFTEIVHEVSGGV